MKWTVARFTTGVHRRWLQAQNNRRIARLAADIEQNSPAADDPRPVVFFNASSRLDWVSQNAAFMLLASWGLRLAGIPVMHFVCRAGMTRCQLGTNKDDPSAPPPCGVCVAQSQKIYRHAQVRWFDYQADPHLELALNELNLEGLSIFEWQNLPLGKLVLPSLRWSLRRHHLLDDEGTRFILCQFILSAWRVAEEFSQFLDETNPRGVVVFNGISFPEAIARRLAQQRGLWVVTHEVGLQPLSGFFTRGQATAYPIDIPEGSELHAAQDELLNAYLEKRLQGNFSMAGIKFWPEMRGLDNEFFQRAALFRQIVPVFTNVIFDTSQSHANIVFDNMFAWLDTVFEIIQAHPETLFIIRAHPDEDRPGKEARESVAGWVQKRGVDKWANVVFVPPKAYISSYELIQRAKFIMIYNSTIGLEAAILGTAVLCAGKARFTQLPTVFLPPSREDYRQMAEDFLTAETIQIPEAFCRNARTFLYYQLFRTSLPFDQYLETDLTPGFVRLRPGLTWRDFQPENDMTMRVIVDGVLRDGDFLLPDGSHLAVIKQATD
jgi:hypothetical protein